MRLMNIVRKYSGATLAFIVFSVAKQASTHFSFIYYLDEVPDKLRIMNECSANDIYKCNM